MDQIIPNVWIGGFPSVKQLRLNVCNIQSILSVVTGKIKFPEIPLRDEQDEDALVYFLPSIAFIQSELDQGRRVLVHCQAGISRSPTIVAAYLMYTRGLDRDAALALIRKARPCVEPNDGFMAQLEVFHRGNCKISRDDKLTRMFYLDRAVKGFMSVDSGCTPKTSIFANLPTLNNISLDSAPSSSPGHRIRCKMCRQELATSEDMLDHGQMSPITPARVAADDISEPGDLSQSTGSNNPLSTMETTFADAHDTHSLGEISHSLHHDHTIPVDGAMPHPIASHPAVTPPSSISTGPSDISTHPRSTTSLPAPSQDQQVVPSTIPRILVNPSCSGYFLEPMEWMKPFLESGELAGRILCPNKKCGAKLGNYDWSGMRCGCKGWVTPGFCISRSKVDQVP